jgi:uncharacterized protein DUF3485
MTRSKFLMIFLFFAVALGLLWQFYPLQDAKARLNEFPLAGAGFVGNDVPLNDFEATAFNNVNVLKRIYRINNENYLLTVLDGTHNRHVVHDPYYCFTGSGWEIQKQKEFNLANGTAEELILSRGTKHRTALFWFSDGKSAFRSPLEYWWKATLRRLTFGKSGQEPVLIMVQPLDSITQVNWKEVTRILNDLVNL